MSDHEVTIDEVLHDMLWSRRNAARLRRAVPTSMFGGLAPVRAVIEDHDLTHPTGPATGPARLQSILTHTLTLAADVDAHPDRYTVAAALHATSRGLPDPMLLARARAVLDELPRLATGTDTAPRGTFATT